MTKRKLAALSPAETEILRLVWKLDRATVQEVHKKLPAKRRIAYATVQTLLRRIEKKGYLRHDVDGKAHVFYSVARREDVIKRSVNDFLNRLFGGDPIPLMHHLATHGQITAEDLEGLREMIEDE